MKKTGILLINLGTPDNTSLPAIKRYLNEFLMDPYVIDIPWIARALLVKGIILRTRPKKTKAAYDMIWTEQGSPLLNYSLKLCDELNQATSENIIAALGMRYGKPSIDSALDTLLKNDLEKLIVIPLFPQYSTAATASAIQAFKKSFKVRNITLPVNIITDFYDQPEFIKAQVSLIKNQLQDNAFDHLLLSYHGIPTRHLEKIGCPHINKACVGDQPCPAISDANKQCYRAQCYATSRLIAKELDLTVEQYSVSFQSRLGKTPWITPYTDEHLKALREKGIVDLVVVCPSFIADCLETLEEIGIRAREQWQQLGGRSFTLIPCINSSDHSYLSAVTRHN